MGEALRRLLPVDACSPWAARRLLRAWLAELGCSDDDIADLVLVVSEAVTNVVDHAYPDGAEGDLISLECRLRSTDVDKSQVVATVSDRGRWRPVPKVNGNRGRGLTMMRSLTESLELRGTPDGTEVRMTSRPLEIRLR
ncbi:MAG TPA: ATP-binding protein [Pseudonocardia sp.]|jgi:anti-sigma regulatory factor (Ser/Thr protein kinase)